MRSFITTYILSFMIVLAANAKTDRDFPVWQTHTVQKGEWIYKLVRESIAVKNSGLKASEVVKEILSRNPQIKNVNQIHPGHQILLPIAIIPKLKSQKNSNVVNYHIYYNSNVNHSTGGPVYMGAVTSQPIQETREKVVIRDPAAKSVTQVELPEESYNREFEWSAGTQFSFSRLDSEDKASLAKASVVSKMSSSFTFSASHLIFKSKRVRYFGFLQSEDYLNVAGSSLFNGASSTNYELGVEYDQPLSDDLMMRPFVALKSRPFVVSSAGAIELQSVMQPVLGAKFKYKVITIKQAPVGLSVNLGYALGGSGGSLSVDSALSYRFGLYYSPKLFGKYIQSSVWVEGIDAKTNVTNQQSQGLGFSVGFKVPFSEL